MSCYSSSNRNLSKCIQFKVHFRLDRTTDVSINCIDIGDLHELPTVINFNNLIYNSFIFPFEISHVLLDNQTNFALTVDTNL